MKKNNEIMGISKTGGAVFPDEETFQKIYGECLENQPQASQKLQDANKALTNAYWEYLAEYEEHTFRYAYRCGYEAALKGGLAV